MRTSELHRRRLTTLYDFRLVTTKARECEETHLELADRRIPEILESDRASPKRAAARRARARAPSRMRR